MINITDNFSGYYETLVNVPCEYVTVQSGYFVIYTHYYVFMWLHNLDKFNNKL